MNVSDTKSKLFMPLTMTNTTVGDAGASSKSLKTSASLPAADCLAVGGPKAAMATLAAACGKNRSPALTSALVKLEQGALLSDGSIGPADAISQLYALQMRQAKEGARRAEGQIRDRLVTKMAEQKNRLAELDKQIEAQKSSGFFSFLSKIFTAIAAAISTISSVFNGGTGAVAAALLIASLIVSSTCKGMVGQIIGNVLGALSAIVTLGATVSTTIADITAKVGKGICEIVGTVAKEVMGACSKICNWVSAGMSLAQAGTGITAGVYNYKSGIAQANAMDIQSKVEKMTGLIGQDRELMQRMHEAETRTIDLMKTTMANMNRGATAAVGG